MRKKDKPIAKKLALKLSKHFPELGDKRMELYELIRDCFSDELRKANTEIEKMLVCVSYGDFRTMLKLISILTENDSLCTQNEREKS